jgi:predicted O-methyltransferase YrrM
MCDRFQSGSIFVELGSWKGKSIIYLTVETLLQGKDIKIFSVDTWEIGNDTWEIFNKNIKPIKDSINIIKKTTFDASQDFEDGSIDFLFIDADHSYEGVKSDLERWYPKVKSGGIISGHDYFHTDFGVRKAVDEFFTKNSIIIEGSCWCVTK